MLKIELEELKEAFKQTIERSYGTRDASTQMVIWENFWKNIYPRLIKDK